MSLAIGKVEATGQMLVACSSCHGPYAVSPRTIRDMRVKNRLPVCPHCRCGTPINVSPDDLVFWLDRFTIQEIVVLAEEIWGPRHKWGPRETWPELAVA